ncbi:MAG: hypothetical protein EXR85_00685 [Xanthomonadales bacterium]|nr:hypothetical protein [Xanthomonadales bacterium]
MPSSQRFKRSNFAGALCVLAFLLVVATHVSAGIGTSNKWRLQFSGNAESDGVISMKFTPKKGEPTVAEIPIKKGTSENGVAKAVVKALREQLPKDQYHIERDDGEDVLVKRRFGGVYFGYALVSNTVKGVRINPDKE